MVKKYRRFVSLLLTFSLLCVSFGAFSVNAQSAGSDKVTAEDLLTPSKNALYGIYGNHMTVAEKRAFKKYGVSIAENTLVEYIGMKSANVPVGVVITQQDNEALSKTLLMSVAQDGEILPITLPVDETASARGGANVSKDIFRDGSLVFQIAIQYNGFTNGYLTEQYFQPISALFIYYKNSGSYNVQEIELEYVCSGNQYTYPEYIAVDTHIPRFTHTIAISKSAPEASRVYSRNNPYRTDRVIFILSSGITGHAVSLTPKINGSYYDYVWDVTQMNVN